MQRLLALSHIVLSHSLVILCPERMRTEGTALAVWPVAAYLHATGKNHLGAELVELRDQGTVMGDSFAKVPKDHDPNTVSMFPPDPQCQCLYTAWPPWLTVEVVWCSRKHMGPGHKPYA